MGNSESFSKLTEEQQMHRRRAKEGRYKERLENMKIQADRDLVDNEYFATFRELYASTMEDLRVKLAEAASIDKQANIDSSLLTCNSTFEESSFEEFSRVLVATSKDESLSVVKTISSFFGFCSPCVTPPAECATKCAAECEPAKCTPAEYTPLPKELEEMHIALIVEDAKKFKEPARWTLAQVRRHYQRYQNEAKAEAKRQVDAPKYAQQLGNRVLVRNPITTALKEIKIAAFCKFLTDDDFIDSHFYMRVNGEWDLYPVTDKNHAPDEGTQVYYVKADTCLLLDRRLQQKNQSLANYIKISNSALLLLSVLGFGLDDGYLRQPDIRSVSGERCDISKQPCLMCRREQVLSTLPLLFCSNCITTKIFEPIGEQIFGLALFKGLGPLNRNQRSKNSAKVYKEIFSMEETGGLISELLRNDSVNTLRSFAQRVEGYQYKEMLERMSGWCEICWSQCTVFEYGRQTAVCNYRMSSSPFYFEGGFRRTLTPIQLQVKELLTSILAPYRLTPTPSKFMAITTIEKPKEKQTSLPSIAIPPMIAFSSNPEKASMKFDKVSDMIDYATSQADKLLNGTRKPSMYEEREALAAREELAAREALAAREELSERAARERDRA